MANHKGILLDLPQPPSWDEAGILAALEIEESENGTCFCENELSFIAKSVAHYMDLPLPEWGSDFALVTHINTGNPSEDGRFVIRMNYPDQFDPPATLR